MPFGINYARRKLLLALKSMPDGSSTIFDHTSKPLSYQPQPTDPPLPLQPQRQTAHPVRAGYVALMQSTRLSVLFYVNKLSIQCITQSYNFTLHDARMILTNSLLQRSTGKSGTRLAMQMKSTKLMTPTQFGLKWILNWNYNITGGTLAGY